MIICQARLSGDVLNALIIIGNHGELLLSVIGAFPVHEVLTSEFPSTRSSPPTIGLYHSAAATIIAYFSLRPPWSHIKDILTGRARSSRSSRSVDNLELIWSGFKNLPNLMIVWPFSPTTTLIPHMSHLM